MTIYIVCRSTIDRSLYDYRPHHLTTIVQSFVTLPLSTKINIYANDDDAVALAI